MHEIPATGQSPAETFDLVALRQRYLRDESKQLLGAHEEVELALIIAGGKAARATLAEAIEAGQSIGEELHAQLDTDIKNGSTAQDVFFAANRGMQITIANAVKRKYWHWPRVEIEELEQVAGILLAANIRNFDPDRGVKFSSMAYTNIYRGLISWVSDSGRLIRHSRGMSDKVTQFRSLVDLGTTPHEAAEATGCTLETLLACEAALQQPDAVSYDLPLLSEGNTTLLEQLSGPDDAITYAEQIIDRISAQTAADGLRRWLFQRNRAHKGLQQFGIDPSRAYNVLLAHYGYGQSLTDISKQQGITRERVAQIIRATKKVIAEKLPAEVSAQIEAAGYSVPKEDT